MHLGQKVEDLPYLGPVITLDSDILCLLKHFSQRWGHHSYFSNQTFVTSTAFGEDCKWPVFLSLYLAGEVPVLNISYKPQKISPKSQGTVRQLLHEKIRDSYIHPQFVTDVMKPLQIEQLMDQEVGIISEYSVRDLLLYSPVSCS